MKQLISFLLLFFLATNFSFPIAQSVGINDNNSIPDSSAMLDVQSNSKGFLAPRMSTAERKAISNPATGLLVFDTDKDQYFFYNGTSWTTFYRWETNGSDVFRESGKVGIGTNNPNGELHVKSTGGEGAMMILENRGSGNATIVSEGGQADLILESGEQTNLKIDNGIGVRVYGGTTASEIRLARSNVPSFESFWGYNATGFVDFGTSENDGLRFWTNNEQRIHIEPNGNIGMGTAAPGAKFEILNGTNGGGVAESIRLNTDGYTNGDGNAITFTRENEIRAQIHALKNEVSNDETDLVFSTFAIGKFEERVRVKGNGYFGIGTFNPEEALHIFRSGAGSPGIILESEGGTNPGAAKIFVSNEENKGGHALHFGVKNAEELVTIKTDGPTKGNMGVGTSNPFSQLEVAGMVHSTNEGFKFPDGTVQTTAAVTDDVDADIFNELIQSFQLIGTAIQITDAGGTKSVELNSLINDADADPANEVNQSLQLVGTELSITDAGGTKTAELNSLINDADPDPENELNQSVQLVGTELRVTDAGGTKATDLGSLINDADADPSNELNQDLQLVGTELRITDAGGAKSTNLGSLINDADSNPNNEIQTLSQSGSNITLSNGGGTISINAGVNVQYDDTEAVFSNSMDIFSVQITLNQAKNIAIHVNLPTYDCSGIGCQATSGTVYINGNLFGNSLFGTIAGSDFNDNAYINSFYSPFLPTGTHTIEFRVFKGNNADEIQSPGKLMVIY
ncbi:MAG: hypothetical protein AAFZ15_00840 [Bacteroidota bacterium]